MFNDELRRRRLESDLRAVDIAKRIGISRAGYSHYENGDSYPGRERLRRICKVVNWDFDEAWDMVHKEKYGGVEPDDQVDYLLQLVERLPLKKRDKIIKAWTDMLEAVV